MGGAQARLWYCRRPGVILVFSVECLGANSGCVPKDVGCSSALPPLGLTQLVGAALFLFGYASESSGRWRAEEHDPDGPCEYMRIAERTRRCCALLISLYALWSFPLSHRSAPQQCWTRRTS
ncbi:hypothetical protein B0H14DRAFT_1064120 [Mycena olivaceomarginata]|nr:hypothetical protein B0H14DRAFT_1064120 [Mycena olivaceomarginata]